ncbi:draxin [Rhinatrema bivittatum]|uniref:draxin n=1 Tax=Rhinatrema bivittatum TaxID=194408 RepID=UPI00112B8B42|nr:draxin [Rhinatrema bivittatum]XP_029434674.1 draxin [Rhinatrema bivittatum]
MRIFPSSSISSFLFLFILMLYDISQVYSLEPAAQKPRKTSERKNLQKQELWLQEPRGGHRHKQGTLKKGRTLGKSSRARGPKGETAWFPRYSSVQEDMHKVEEPAFLGLEFLHPEREKQKKKRLKQYSDPGSLHQGAAALADQNQKVLHAGSTLRDAAITHIISPPLAASTEGPAAVSPRPQVHGRKDGDVMPTLDMTLFDWTDYEELKPESWPSNNKKEKRHKKTTGNETVTEGDACDHHLDCLAGSCCDLREHICKLHGRGLNNKCYDDCMCTDGLRCYAKFHRNGKVRRRKGRCVDPESVTSDRGSFLTV